MSMLWVDKYRPKDFSNLDYHIQLAKQLKNLVETSDFPHLLVYGPSGAGKKTRIMCILRELYGPGVEKLKIETMTVTTPSNKKLEITTVSSNYHIEMNPSDVGIYDRVVVMDLIKNIAQTQQILTTNTKREFKVVVLTEVDNLSKDAQEALRRTMEKYSSNCRLILCTNSLSPVIPAIQSRCLPIRVPAPSTEEITQILLNTCKKEDVNIPLPFAQKIACASDGNLRRALLMCEACKVEQYPFKDNQNIAEPDWKLFIKETAKMLNADLDKPLEQLLHIRENLYELLTNGIPAEVVLRGLLEELLLTCDPEHMTRVAREAAISDYRMSQGNKPIVHLEAFVLKYMAICSQEETE